MQRFRYSFTLLFLISLISFQTTYGQADTNKFSDFALQIPRENTEIFAVNNLGQHVETLLNNKALRRVVQDFDAANLDMDEVLEDFELFKPSLPDTIAVSGNDEIYAAAFNLAELMLRVNLSVHSQFEEDNDDAELALLVKEIVANVDDFKIPDSTVWLTWSDEGLAKELFRSFKQQVSVVEFLTDLRFKSDQTSFRVSGLAADIADEEAFRSAMDFLGLEDPDDEILISLLEIDIFFEAELVGNGMRVSLGTDPADKPRTTAADLRGIQNGANQIAYSQWNGVRMKKAAAKFEDAMQRWAKTKIGKDFIATDLEDVWGSFKGMAQQMDSVPDNGQLRVWTENNQVHSNIRETGLPAVETLVGSSVLNMIPVNSESYILTNHLSLGEYLFEMLEGVEERASTQSLRSAIRGEDEKTEMLDFAIATYFEHFGPMREVIRDELAEIPTEPLAILVDTQGVLNALEVDSNSLDSPLRFSSDRFLRMAAISKVDDSALMQNKMMAVYRSFVEGFFSLNDTDVPDDIKFFGDIKLGSGIKGKEFLVDWVEQIDSAKIEIDGDLRPHIFVKDGFVVFSTSIQFSKTIIETKKPLQLKAVAADQSLVDIGHVRGTTIGNTLRTLFQVVGDGMNQQMGSAPGLESTFDDMSNSISDFCGIMNHLDWTSTQKGDVRNSRYIMDFKDK